MIRASLAAAAVVIGLSGCAAQQLQPLGMPSIAQIQADMAAVNQVSAASVPAFYQVGLTDIRAACGSYFDAAVMAELQSAQKSGAANLLQGLGLGVLGLAGVGGPATVGVGLAGTFAQGVIANESANSLAGRDPAATATLVESAMDKLVAATQNPTTAAEAWQALNNIYDACSPHGIQALKEQAIAAAPAHLVVTGGSGSPATAAQAVAPHSLPRVRVQ